MERERLGCSFLLRSGSHLLLHQANGDRDMQEERDIVVKRVIPKLRKICLERDVSFSYVDLRWYELSDVA
jgi:hypothetical protein